MMADCRTNPVNSVGAVALPVVDGSESDGWETDGSQKPHSNLHTPSPNVGKFAAFELEDQPMQLRYQILHSVRCRQDVVEGEDHTDHNSEEVYLDIPKLYTNDSRASCLRGRTEVPDGDDDEWWEDRPIVITRRYNCAIYHRSLRARFKPIMPGIDRQLPSKLRPWIYKLSDDGDEADPYDESIEISTRLNQALKEYTTQRPDFIGPWDPNVGLQAPYDYFYHFRRQLRSASGTEFEQPEKAELNLLLDYIDDTYGANFDKIDESLMVGMVDWFSFSKLFAPDDIVVSLRDEHPRAYTAKKAVTSIAGLTITLECWTWIFDGSFRKATETIVVTWPGSPTDDKIPVTNLAAWPLRYDTSGLKERLLERGRNFWSCRNRRLVSYEAPASSVFELQVTNPKYMIDYKTYRQMFPANFKEPMLSDSDMKQSQIDMGSSDPPTEEFCILLPATMVGYAFHDKKWRSLSVEHVVEVKWNKDAFDRLVLKADKKKAVKALVSVHLSSRQNQDVVENKGNGLIVLLHGSPGTGKTLTAESVAEIAEKPLYRVTCGDIGTTPENVEKYLESVLLIGSIWRCVVLLDEADIFLEERQVSDLARNALVSVFLRVLEYYDGILILTTNRVGSFDEAFKSRVQLALHYPKLEANGRQRIWTNFIHLLRDQGTDMDFDGLEREVRTLANMELNGRQIRNILWTAAQIAKFDRERLSYTQLELVVEITKEFEDYLLDTHGKRTDEDDARIKELRHS